jgi:predicted nucleotidyltransferase
MYANFFDILLQPYGISHGVSGGDVRYSRSWVSREYIKIYIPFLKREFTIEAAVPILVKYGAQLGYNKTKDVLDIIRALFQLDKEYSELRKKGMTPNGFRISQLSDDDKKRYKELGNKINELKDQLKLEFLKERNRECKVDIQEELKILEKVVDIIKASEKSKTIAKRYVGHLERWIETIRTMSP